MSDHPGALSIPDTVSEDSDAAEIARVWAASGKQHISLRVGVWKDPAAWGVFLVDLARHAANAYQQDEGRDRQHVLSRIKEGFNAEWDSPTDEPEGRLLD